MSFWDHVREIVEALVCSVCYAIGLVLKYRSLGAAHDEF